MKILPKIKHAAFIAKKLAKDSLQLVRGRTRGIVFQYNVENLKSNPPEMLPHPVKWKSVYEDKPIWVEIGSGHGEVLAAAKNKDHAIIGFEWKSRFFKLCHHKIRNIPNAIVYKGNGYDLIPLLFEKESIDRLLILFPDPWHKVKHHKRRPIVAPWLRKIARRLKPGGEILIATDWVEYAQFISEQLLKVSAVYDVEKDMFSPENFDLPVTHYYQKWKKVGRRFRYFRLIKK